MSGEWDEQQKIGCCIEDTSRQQRPEMDKGKRETPNPPPPTPADRLHGRFPHTYDVVERAVDPVVLLQHARYFLLSATIRILFFSIEQL